MPEERWQEAQTAELALWRRKNSRFHALLHSALYAIGIRKTRCGDDWNSWWYEQFDGYRLLPPHFNKAIELGCGPYTNIRLIRKDRTIDEVVCSDPLSGHYVRFAGQWLATEYARGTIGIDDHPIEKCSYPDGNFDLVVLVNVLDHVQDSNVCIDVAKRITKPGGYLVFGQDLTNEEDLARVGEDITHPIRLHHDDLDAQLSGSIMPLLRKILPREKGRNPRAHYGTYLLIGRKYGFPHP